jgi:uncharacterized protein (DUF697 family)
MVPTAAEAPDTDKSEVTASPPVPVIWLLGKVQSGKTSIISALTGVTDVAIGDGYRACTRASVIFDFPADAAVIRFLDTRGLSEAGYDPADDIAYCEGRAHLVLATLRAMDLQQDVVLATLIALRQRHPSWPIVVAQTNLHEGYGAGGRHVVPYPFDPDGRPTDAVPTALARSLRLQRASFDALPGSGSIRFVPIDFTRAGDGLEPAAYGLAALQRALSEAAPLALAAALADEQLRAGDDRARTAHARILRHAVAAAASDLVPIAGAIAVPGVQARLLQTLAQLYGVAWDRRAAAEFAGALGTTTVARLLGTFGLRQLGKLIPGYGQTVGAAAASAASFASTYALGKAAVYYLGRRHLGAGASEGVTEAYSRAFAEAFRLARTHADEKHTRR